MRNTEGYYPITLSSGEVIWLPRVTFILEVIDRRGLNEWRVSKGREEADAISEDTADVGKQVHAIIERISNGDTISAEEWKARDTRVQNAVRAWIRWRDNIGFIPKHTEIVVYSLVHGYAGKLDSVGTHKPKIPILTDYKVTGRIYKDTNFAQAVAYKHAYLEMYPQRRIDEVHVTRLDKETGIPEDHVVDDEDLYWRFFSAALNLFQIKREIGG